MSLPTENDGTVSVESATYDDDIEDAIKVQSFSKLGFASLTLR